METQTYLGDGVYATYDGYQIKLEANGTGMKATDTIYLEPSAMIALNGWRKNNHVDYNTGKAWGKE